jgi:5'-3' exonuclease
MIIVDMNQVMIASLMASLRGQPHVEENLIRHMVLNTLRVNRLKFKDQFGDMVIACDDKNYWRKQIFPYYKASRKQMREKSPLDWNAIFQTLNKIRDEIRDNFPYPVIRVESAEADDIIASFCHENGRELGGDPILILSGDKDFMQLQKYANVKQYDPVRKRFLECSDPNKFLVEHILRGDSGDGVPNFLSSDDTFVSNSRQKQLRQKVIDQILSADWPEDWTGMNEELIRNFNRNRLLIDLDRVPDEIRDEVKTQYQQQSEKDRSKLFNYFIKNKLKHMMENINEF